MGIICIIKIVVPIIKLEEFILRFKEIIEEISKEFKMEHKIYLGQELEYYDLKRD